MPSCATNLLLLLLLLAGNTVTASAQEESGRELYHSGEGATAVLTQGRVKVPASRFPCANCHGQDGMGNREGGTIMPPISWQLLTEPSSKRPAYTIDSFQRALLHGKSSSGETLGELMPRYEIQPELVGSLVDYLQTLDAEQRTGITTDTISIALPQNADTRIGFIEAMKRFNSDGGSYGRTVVSSAEGSHFLSADSFSSIVSEQLAQEIQKQLLHTLADDGVSVVALTGGDPEPALQHKLHLAGIEYNSKAAAMLIPDDTVNLQAIVSWLEHANQNKLMADTDQSIEVPRIYASASAIAPYTQAINSIKHELVLIDLDESSVRWALSNRYNARTASGFSMGVVLAQALLLSGRDPTRHAVISKLNEMDFQARLFTWRGTVE